MRVIEPGHVYEVQNVDGIGTQRIDFVRRRNERGELLDSVGRTQGILTQELLRVAIDRTLYLYAEDPCDEDTEIINHLRAALILNEGRAARRSIEKLAKPEEAPVCDIYQHILCRHPR